MPFPKLPSLPSIPSSFKDGAKKIGGKFVEKAIYWKLEKLLIRSFNDSARQGASKDFKVMFNPESYSLTHENVYGGHQGINTTGHLATYTLSKPSVLSLKLIFDGTDANEQFTIPLFDNRVDVSLEWPPTKLVDTVSISDRIADFLLLTAHMDGSLHEPKYVRLLWGKLNFDCRLKSVKTTYTLFDPSGNPLRAELDTVFVSDMDKNERVRRENKRSPDLTHKRIVQAGDTLPLMCYEIYGSEHYYLQVAKTNNLIDFRNLTPGQELFFPPIEK